VGTRICRNLVLSSENGWSLGTVVPVTAALLGGAYCLAKYWRR
jgi:hypothetical protein